MMTDNFGYDSLIKKYNRLLCFGDSFVQDSKKYRFNDKSYEIWANETWGTNTSWIDDFSDMLNLPVGHVGQSGTGPSDVFWQISNFLSKDTFYDDDLVIIVWSCFRRVMDKFKKPLHMYNHYDPVKEADLYIATKYYYEYIYNVFERLNVYNMSVKAVDSILSNVKSNIFHFYSFELVVDKRLKEQVKQIFYPTTGHLCKEFSLIEIASKYYKGYKPEDTWWKRDDGDVHPNHLGPLANLELINYLKNRI